MEILYARLPGDGLAEVQAIRHLFAQLPAWRNAIISEPVLGLDGEVVLEVRRGRSTAFRVVAPTPEKAYALLHELVSPLANSTHRLRELPSGRQRRGASKGRPRRARE